ncbi:MAG: cyclic lactone autoinducer peptide [Clostridium sp.]|jgi:cyclic lactone autoinducer peptide|nr:cyclic lactone autoinducer peptide [Clostridium sp.]
MAQKGFLAAKLIEKTNQLALKLVVQNANSACMNFFHQPRFPKEAQRYKKVQE